MDAIKSFIKTTLLGGILVVLPLVILVFVFAWLYEFIVDKLQPLTIIILETAKIFDHRIGNPQCHNGHQNGGC